MTASKEAQLTLCGIRVCTPQDLGALEALYFAVFPNATQEHCRLLLKVEEINKWLAYEKGELGTYIAFQIRPGNMVFMLAKPGISEALLVEAFDALAECFRRTILPALNVREATLIYGVGQRDMVKALERKEYVSIEFAAMREFYFGGGGPNPMILH
jgi:hypothetical protein